MEEKDREEELKGGTGWYADVPDIVFVIDHVPGVIVISDISVVIVIVTVLVIVTPADILWHSKYLDMVSDCHM